MARAEVGAHIDRPPDEVFAFVSDVTNNPLWRKNVVRAEWFDDGPMRLGRRGSHTQHLLGRDWTVIGEVIEWDPPRQVTFQAVQGPVKARSWVRVEPDGEGSMVTGGADGGFSGPIGRLLTRLAQPRMVKQAHIDLQALRARLESG